MHINWLGQTCVKIQIKNLKDEDVVILLDAYKATQGDFPRSFSPNVALFSHGEKDAATLSQDPFVLNTLGEVEIKDVMIYSLPGDNTSAVFKIIAEGITLVHLGTIIKKPDSATIGKLNGPDILLLPVGGDGKSLIDPALAAELCTAIEPRIVIPIAYQCDTDPKAAPLSQFIKESGMKAEETEKKLIIKKKDLPQEETILKVLEKNY